MVTVESYAEYQFEALEDTYMVNAFGPGRVVGGGWLERWRDVLVTGPATGAEVRITTSCPGICALTVATEIDNIQCHSCRDGIGVDDWRRQFEKFQLGTG